MNGRAIFSAAMASLSLLLATSSQGSDGDTLYLVDVYGRREIKADAAKKLAPALLATRDGGGVLKGCDASGKPVIAVPAAKLEKIHQSKAVRAISAEVPKDWQPVHKLKLSYKRDDPPSLAELKHLGLKLVEDYQKGGIHDCRANGRADRLRPRQQTRALPQVHVRHALVPDAGDSAPRLLGTVIIPI